MRPDSEDTRSARERAARAARGAFAAWRGHCCAPTPPGGPRIGRAGGTGFIAAAALVLVTGGPALVRAQVDSTHLVIPGRLAERMDSPTDTSQRYALYLPSSYTAERTWPVLVVMDPRGQAVPALRLFQPAAERDGYIVMSSYETRSDGPVDPNVRAVNAMLADAQASFSLDPHRLYFAGMSGTAAVAWGIALELPDRVAGVVSASGVASVFRDTAGAPPFAFFGTAGTHDFNYEQLVAFEPRLAKWKTPHRLRYFDGPHGWPPAVLCAEALDWLSLEAMRAGTAPRRTAWIDSLYESEAAAARALEAAGDLPGAVSRWRDIEASFSGLRDVAAAHAKAEALAAEPAVRTAAAQRDSSLARAGRFGALLGAVMTRIREAGGTPDPDRLRELLGIDPLRRAAADSTDAAAAAEAARFLALVFVQAGFYQPRQLIKDGKPGSALAVLRLADVIRPDQPGVLLRMAQAYAGMKMPREAMLSLHRAVEGGLAADLDADPYLASLRGDPRFAALAARARTAQSSK